MPGLKRKIEVAFPEISSDIEIPHPTWRDGALFSDWKLRTGPEQVYSVHRIVLGNGPRASALLHKSFTSSGFKSFLEQETDFSSLLPGVCKGHIFEVALDYVYSGVLPLKELSAEDLVLLCKIADVLQMKALLEASVAGLNAESAVTKTSAPLVLSALHESGGFGEPLTSQIESLAAQTVAVHFRNYAKEERASWTAVVLQRVLSEPDLNTSSEDDVFEAIYAVAPLESSSECRMNLWTKVRFGHLSPELLVQAAQVEEIPKELFVFLASVQKIPLPDRERLVPSVLAKISAQLGPLWATLDHVCPRHKLREIPEFLKPSLKGTHAMTGLSPVLELQGSESPITCMCFGQERQHKAFILLAIGSKDGTATIYRCHRTEMEISMLADCDFLQDGASQITNTPTNHSNISVQSRLIGHSRAITSIFFNLVEDWLVTSSIDHSVRVWSVDAGQMLKVFTDSSPVPVAAFLPLNPMIFVAANSNAVLRLVNIHNGTVHQKLRVESDARALRFDDTGIYAFVGTKTGSIHVLEVADSSTLRFNFKMQLSRGSVTCIVFVPAKGQTPCLLVNTMDSSVAIVDCIYASAHVLTNLTVRRRVQVAHSLLPLKCCYSSSGGGFLISGSEDKDVYVHSLLQDVDSRLHLEKHHDVPIVAVACNHQDTLLASGDSLGRLVFWRRLDFIQKL